jgi:hypothetical protein
MNNIFNFKKKYRWALEGTFPNGDLKPIFVKIYSDPEVENYFTVCIHEDGCDPPIAKKLGPMFVVKTP